MSDQATFRDFIYLDLDRIQSIVAQLQEGLLVELIEGTAEGKGGAAGILSQLIPITLSANYQTSTDFKQSRVLHDYAYNEALASLTNAQILSDASNFGRDDFSPGDSSFVLVKGAARIVDYGDLRRIGAHETELDQLRGGSDSEVLTRDPTQSQNRQQRRRQERDARKRGENPNQSSMEASKPTIKRLSEIAQIFFGDSVHVTITNDAGVRFVGVINREYLREESRQLIFKYGAEPQGKWALLAQVTRVPERRSSLNNLEELISARERLDMSEVQTGSEAFDPMLRLMNALQESIGSVAYPAIAVSPIAVYRETSALNGEKSQNDR